MGDIDLTMPNRTLTLIAAASLPHLGIGRAGALPWPMLKGEMAFFKRVTSDVGLPTGGHVDGEQHSGKRRMNAVIMGRRTWEGIPKRFRPLKGRVNVVVTSKPDSVVSTSQPASNASKAQSTNGEKENLLDAASKQAQAQAKEAVADEGPYTASSLTTALLILWHPTSLAASAFRFPDSPITMGSVQIAQTYIIGGSSLYNDALAHPACTRVLFTQVHKDYECDVFWPLDMEGEDAASKGWARGDVRAFLEDAEGKEEAGDTMREEKGVKYQFCLYERPEQPLSSEANQATAGG